MLILTRKLGECIQIGDNIQVRIIDVKGKQVRIGIDAPSNLPIHREEIYLKILNENKQAAEKGISNIRDISAELKKKSKTEESKDPHVDDNI